MNKKRPEATIKTKQAITDAFWTLYKKRRIETISVKDITTKAGYNRSTFYVYFKDVYDVLEQLEETLMPGIEHLPPVGAGLKGEVDLMENIINIYEKNAEYYSVLLSEDGDPHFATKMKHVFKSMMMETLDRQIDQSKIEIDYALEFLVSATLSTVKYWYDQGKNMPMEQLASIMVKLMDNQLVREFGVLSENRTIKIQ